MTTSLRSSCTCYSCEELSMSDTEALLGLDREMQCTPCFYIEKKETNTFVRVWHVVGTSKPLFKQKQRIDQERMR